MASRSMVHDKSRQCEEGLLLLMAKWHSRSIVYLCVSNCSYSHDMEKQ